MVSLDLTAIYQDLHQHPELSFAEHRTAALVAGHLRAMGLEVTEGVGRTGVVGLLRNGDGPMVALRADMDALPVAEATGLPYASTVPEVMHACGHDMHVTWLLGALETLLDKRTEWAGTIMAIFQPAEENGGGAQVMVDDGLFERHGTPQVVLGQHVTPLPAGTVGYRSGPLMAASDAIDVRLYGRGGHGSRPEWTVDPVVMAAATVLRMQTVVARDISPNEIAVLTVGSIHSGTKHNIIPAHADLQISIRSFTPEVRRQLLSSIDRIARAEAAASGATREPDVVRTSGYPVLFNDHEATERTIAAIREVADVIEIPPVPASEDFGSYGAAAGIPSVFWFVGGSDPELVAKAVADGRLEQDIPSNHSPFYAPVIEPTLPAGVRTMTAAALAWLDRGRTGESDG